MPWPTGTPAWLKNQWGIISGQVSARATTAQLIDSLRSAAARAPGGLSFQAVTQIQQIRSVAVQIRNAADQIVKDGFTGAVAAQHIATAPWARSPLQQQLAPRFMIRSLVTSENPEHAAGVAGVPEELDRWITHYTSALPGTLEELSQQVIEKAEQEGSPPLPVTDIKRIEIIRE